MDVLEMVLPGTLLQQSDQQQSLRCSVLESKCSSKWSTVGCISTPRVARKTEHSSSPNAKSKESLKCRGSSQQPFDDVSDLSRYLVLDSSGANVTPRSSLDPESVAKPVKKIKKKNKKKGRNYANFSENVSAETGPTECAQNIAIAPSQSSKEGGNEKDDIAIANCGGHSDLTGIPVLSDVVNKPRCDHNFQTGKANGHSIWQKSRKSFRDGSTHWVKRSNIHVQKQKDVNLQEENFLVKHNSFSSDALLPSPIVSARHDIAAQGVNEVVKNKQVIDCRTHSNGMAESSRWTAQRFHGGLNQYDSESAQDDIAGNTDWRKLKETLNQSFKHKYINNRKQNVGGYKANAFRLQDKMIAPQKDALDVSRELHLCNKSAVAQISIHNNQRNETDESEGLHLYPTSANLSLNLPLTAISGVPGQAVLPGVDSVKISMVEQVLVGTPPISLDNGQRDPACLDINLCLEDNIRKDYTSQASTQKWIPIGGKKSRIVENLGSVGACNERKGTSNSCKEKAEVRLEEHKICGCESVAPVDPGKTCLMSGHEISTVMTIKSEIPQFDRICNKVKENHNKESVRDYVTSGNNAKTSPLLDIGSHSAVKTLDAAYRLQMASESVQLATGCPLAEFERLVHSATPVIVPTCVLQDCSVCSGNQRSRSSLCKHQIPNIPLSAVWNWYEKPGNYGLEVKAQDLKNLKGFDIDSGSFKAHFVPFLSAVQLFGRPHLSRCRNQVQHNSEMQEIRDGEQCSSSLKNFMKKSCPGAVEPNRFKGEELSASLLFKSVADPMNSTDIFPAAGNHSFGSTSTPTCSDNMELIFEFFEHEQPQQRKPLYDKVMELVKAGSSSYRVFGDSSKLECMNLHDLHPASWYSVAWYPIYRIPEGNFRASFLTYHSLGHLVQRCSIDSHEKKQFSVVSPVLGLQSYNTQGECWFCPKKPFEYSKGCTTFNSSEILKERLSTLEETALLFARGCIYKDDIKVTNRQPDYEFFLSRKRGGVY